MFADYRKLVWKTYERKRAAGLSLKLVHPTPAGLRDLCMVECQERFQPRDTRTLRDFFEEGTNQESFLKAIRHMEPSRFKPLVNYLKDPEINTEDKNVELLAWLIDFEQRPFLLGKKYGELVEVNNVEETFDRIGFDEPADGSSKEAETVEERGESKEESAAAPSLRARLFSFALIIAVLAGSGIILLIFSKKEVAVEAEPVAERASFAGLQKCMYWTGEKYALVSCTQSLPDSLAAVGFDSLRFHQLKRINRTDTITLKSLGYVWYLKRKKKLEYFTAAGYHPVYRKSKLHPITPYIINKYLLGN